MSRTHWMNAERRMAWRAGLRWFAAEFLVVVSGVLVALAVQSAYQSRLDAETEQAYLAQLTADLKETEHTLQQAADMDTASQAANADLLAALYDAKPLAPAAAKHWFSMFMGRYSDPRPVMGTVETLIATGDIRLIRNPTLRSRIMAYGSLVASDQAELSRNVDRLIRANDAWRARMEFHGLPPAPVSEDYSDEQMAALFPRFLDAWPAIRADPELRVHCQTRLTAYFNRIWYLDRLRTATAELRGMLEKSR